ncbi:MAG: UDP-N-acetylmuramoyl-tripeptide--D-alanyl-D-alanine ligase [Deltaproteobacteria bacterium]|nr:UDP-N-acetylmuramoyl-tripeptide--D-alanyl-D-alanine ligase [Deltaproteobacteria bacterium]
MVWTTENILNATGGTLLCGKGNQTFSGISIDSRRIRPDMLFVAIRGQKHDAHRFVQDVISNGVRGVVVEKRKSAGFPLSDWHLQNLQCIAVDDTTRALGLMAAFNRDRHRASVVAVTGSTGKTTTREMIQAVVSQKYHTLTSKKNYNNEIGLPLTLLELSPHHQWAIVELGMNHLGEISRLTRICRPDIGVITNIGPVHLEGVGSIEGVMRAKGELLEEMDPQTTAVLNADDEYVLKLARDSSVNIVLFGQSEKALIRAQAPAADGQEIGFRLILPEQSCLVRIGVPGKFMVSNALAASAVGYLLGLSAQEIKTGLERFRPIENRMNIVHTTSGIHIVNDAYNANPTSMEAAIGTLASLKGPARGVLVIGDMLELGAHAESMHKNLGMMIARFCIERLYVTGDFADVVQSGALEGGMAEHQILLGTKDEIFQDLIRWIQPGDWILVKGSRAMGMEDIVHRVVEWEKQTSSIHAWDCGVAGL